MYICSRELEPTEVINIKKCQVSLRKSSYSRTHHHREPMTFFWEKEKIAFADFRVSYLYLFRIFDEMFQIIEINSNQN